MGFGSCKPWALQRGLSICGTRGLVVLGIEPMFPAFAGGFLSTVPIGKSCEQGVICHLFSMFNVC